MTTWQYMFVNDDFDRYQTRTMVSVGPPEFTEIEVNPDDLPGEPLLALLNELGADGWEVFSVREDASSSTYWLKRPKPENPEGGWIIGA